MTESPLPIAVLVSGSGSNLQALLDAPTRETDFTICSVISDRTNVRALDRAQDAGVEAVVVPWSDFDSREAFTTTICDAALGSGASGLVLAGFMRILSRTAIERFPDAIINVHPALLPAFPGARAVENALQHGVTITGVTVHFVDEQVDHGPIIAQEAVEVRAEDDATSLHGRIQAVEHRLLPEVVAAFGRGLLTVHDRYVRWEHESKEGVD
jgi:phosphoribosylglycinamide formyltransferase-1